MGDKTPKRIPQSPSSITAGFSPITLPESPAAASPQKNLTGLPRVARDLVADIYNTIQKWNSLQISGAGLVKEIATIKGDDPKNFSPALELLCTELYGTVQKLRVCKEVLEGFVSQIRALEKLQKKQEPLFISLDVKALADLVEDVSKAYSGEFLVKESILEHIAHSKDKSEAMFLALLWTYQCNVNDRINLKLEVLLIETGHRKFN